MHVFLNDITDDVK